MDWYRRPLVYQVVLVLAMCLKALFAAAITAETGQTGTDAYPALDKRLSFIPRDFVTRRDVTTPYGKNIVARSLAARSEHLDKESPGLGAAYQPIRPRDSSSSAATDHILGSGSKSSILQSFQRVASLTNHSERDRVFRDARSSEQSTKGVDLTSRSSPSKLHLWSDDNYAKLNRRSDRPALPDINARHPLRRTESVSSPKSQGDRSSPFSRERSSPRSSDRRSAAARYIQDSELPATGKSSGLQRNSAMRTTSGTTKDRFLGSKQDLTATTAGRAKTSAVTVPKAQSVTTNLPENGDSLAVHASSGMRSDMLSKENVLPSQQGPRSRPDMKSGQPRKVSLQESNSGGLIHDQAILDSKGEIVRDSKRNPRVDSRRVRLPEAAQLVVKDGLWAKAPTHDLHFDEEGFLRDSQNSVFKATTDSPPVRDQYGLLRTPGAESQPKTGQQTSVADSLKRHGRDAFVATALTANAAAAVYQATTQESTVGRGFAIANAVGSGAAALDKGAVPVSDALSWVGKKAKQKLGTQSLPP